MGDRERQGLSDPLDELADSVRRLLGRPLSKAARAQFERYLALLLAWNRTHRITAVTEPRDIVRKLFVDALLFLPLLPPGPTRIVDIGTGAGIPGIPMRIVEPRLSLTLIEARRKRVSFLAELKRKLELDDLEIIHGRAEEVGPGLASAAGGFDVAVMRASGPATSMAKQALTYVRPFGLVLVSGPPPGQPLPPLPKGLEAEWKTVMYEGLRLTRVFLVVRKRP